MRVPFFFIGNPEWRYAADLDSVFIMASPVEIRKDYPLAAHGFNGESLFFFVCRVAVIRRNPGYAIRVEQRDGLVVIRLLCAGEKFQDFLLVFVGWRAYT